MDIQQVLAQPPQSRRRYQRPVDQDGPAAAARELAGNDELPFIDFDVVGLQELFQPFRQRRKKERAFDEERVRPVADERCRCAFACQHTDGVEENRFAGACFAGKNRHPVAKSKVQVFNQSKIVDVQGLQHKGLIPSSAIR